MARRFYPALTLLLEATLLAKMVYSTCPDTRSCDCTPNYINCTCVQNGEVNFAETSQKFAIKEFIVSGCERLRLKESALTDMDVQSVRLSNLLELHIEPLAFHNWKIKDLIIYNIGNLTLDGRAFAGIKNMTSIIVKNVTLEKLTIELFSETTVPTLIIKDSRIKTIETASFRLKHCKKITVENNTIGVIKTGSFRIESTENFTFTYNAIQQADTFSYTFDSVKNVQFKNCRINEIKPTMILTRKVDLFEFQKNYIRNCEEKAFSAMRDCKSLNFVGNQILIAKNNSLIPNEELSEGELQGITSENNEIGCDCGIEWLVATNNPKYARFKERNVCHYPGNLRGLSLSLLGIERSKDAGCTTLGRLSSIATDGQLTTNASVPEATKSEGNVIADHSTVTSTDAETNRTVDSSSGQLMKGDQMSSKDDKVSDGNSAKTYKISATVLLLALAISTN